MEQEIKVLIEQKQQERLAALDQMGKLARLVDRLEGSIDSLNELLKQSLNDSSSSSTC